MAGDPASYPSAAVCGTAVHTRLRDMIRALDDPRLTAEIALMKQEEDDPAALGSVRIDIVETQADGTVCVYDIKTGKRGLGSKRISEFVSRLGKRVRRPNQVVVIEIRPFE